MKGGYLQAALGIADMEKEPVELRMDKLDPDTEEELLVNSTLAVSNKNNTQVIRSPNGVLMPENHRNSDTQNVDYRERIVDAIQGLPTSVEEVLHSTMFDSFDHQQLTQGYMHQSTLRMYIASWLLSNKQDLFPIDLDSVERLLSRTG